MPTQKITCTLDVDLIKKVDKLTKDLIRKSRSNTIEYMLRRALDLPEFLGGQNAKTFHAPTNHDHNPKEYPDRTPTQRNGF